MPSTVAPSLYERLLAFAALAMLAVVGTAIARGAPAWAQVPAMVWAHLLTVLIALVLTPIMLLRPRGTRAHRLLGTIWIAAMFTTAVFSLFLKLINRGHFSPIHLLSLLVIVAAPRALWLARRHRIVEHRRTVDGLVTGALIIAGVFTFPFGRLLGNWLFG